MAWANHLSDKFGSGLETASGTTGVPKGVVRDNGGHAVALHWSLRNIYGVQPDEVFWTASDVGWAVGHSYTVYTPLLLGCTTVMYESKPVGTPDAGAFWRVIEQHRVRVFFTAPTAFRAVKREDPDGRLIRGRDLSRFRALFLAGERADPPTVAWAEEHLRVPATAVRMSTNWRSPSWARRSMNSPAATTSAEPRFHGSRPDA